MRDVRIVLLRQVTVQERRLHGEMTGDVLSELQSDGRETGDRV